MAAWTSVLPSSSLMSNDPGSSASSSSSTSSPGRSSPYYRSKRHSWSPGPTPLSYRGFHFELSLPHKHDLPISPLSCESSPVTPSSLESTGYLSSGINSPAPTTPSMLSTSSSSSSSSSEFCIDDEVASNNADPLLPDTITAASTQPALVRVSSSASSSTSSLISENSDPTLDYQIPAMRDGEIPLGDRTLDSVVTWLVLKNQDKELQSSFLYTFRLCSTNEEMIAVLHDIATRMHTASPKVRTAHSEKLYQFLCTWLACGMERAVVPKVLQFAQNALPLPQVNKLKLMAVKETAGGGGVPSRALDTAVTAASGSRSPSWRVSLSSSQFGSLSESSQVLSVSSSSIANQLTLIQANMLARVLGNEFLKQAWQSPLKETLAPNLSAACNRFNQVSYWAATEVILGATPKAQAKVMQKMIKIADKLYALNNFDTCMSIIAGLNNTAVTRLKKLQARLPSKARETLTRLETAMSFSNNYRGYRDRLSFISKQGVPLVPYMALILKDVTFINDGNSDQIDGIIHSEKLFRLGGTIVSFMKMRDVPYTMKVEDSLNRMLLNLKCLPEKRLLEYSLAAEPNDALSEIIKGDTSDMSPLNIGLGGLFIASPSPTRRRLTSQELNAQSTSPKSRPLEHSRRSSFLRAEGLGMSSYDECTSGTSSLSSSPSTSSISLSLSSSPVSSPASAPVSPILSHLSLSTRRHSGNLRLD
eukprot:TRINITY_DN1017_c0_g1_i4.p1 TRINITY_DN1017_c0_g1~~TRINITY_DN1017_c0_g1_i4.p1  ORF type:complete len:704 (-),score=187.22 TRINITY_DN1017_c0_g1_i4:302-2413(-)